MKSLRHYTLLILVAFVALTFQACKKDPVAEVPEEEISKAELTFLEVEREAHGDHFDYEPIAGAQPLTITFDAKGLAPVGTHAHLIERKTYKVILRSFDFAGREMQQEFVEKPEIHQAFILGAPAGTLTYAYGDKDASGNAVNVGVTGYLTVDKHTETGFTFRYVLRHLNPGVKANIKATDWNNDNFASLFAGANDLDLKFELHPVEAGGHGH